MIVRWHIENIIYAFYGVIEEVAIMIRTGASEKAVSNFVENVYRNGEVSDRVYCILLDMIIENY